MPPSFLWAAVLTYTSETLEATTVFSDAACPCVTPALECLACETLPFLVSVFMPLLMQSILILFFFFLSFFFWKLSERADP